MIKKHIHTGEEFNYKGQGKGFIFLEDETGRTFVDVPNMYDTTEDYPDAKITNQPL